MARDEDNDDGVGGRSAERRAFRETHRYGEQLVGLDDVQLEALGLPDHIVAEIRIGRGIAPSSARNRQIAYVDKLVRQLDEEELEAIGTFLADPDAAHDEHEEAIDGLLARLFDEGDAAVAELVEADPTLEVQRLRQLIRNARKERKQGREGKAHRELRRLLGAG